MHAKKKKESQKKKASVTESQKKDKCNWIQKKTSVTA